MNVKGRIVVLEEDPLIRPLLERWLGEAGYEVAASMTDGQIPALVVANLPDPQSAEAFVGSLGLHTVPILLLSARFHSGLDGSVVAARRLGVARVLPKPFTRKQLLAAVRASIKS